MKSTNPTTGAVLHEYSEHTDEEVAQRCQRAMAAFTVWRLTPLVERCQALRRMAQALESASESLARLITDEMGKPITQSEAEVLKCAGVCGHYAEHAQELLAERPVATSALRSYVRHDPLGPVLAIMPWNFPCWQVFRFAAPALAAGNVVLLKHASNVSGTALAIERLFEQAGFPEGILSVLLIASSRIPEVIRHEAVRGVTLTGSDRAGAEVAAEAGRQIKKTVLELGGSDAFLVLADADVPQAAKAAAQARTINSGQSCIAAKRFIVEQSIAQEFEHALVEEMQRLKVGDPLDRWTMVGPLARFDLLETLHGQVQRTVEAGGRLLCGGARMERPGFFYAPTVLGSVHPGMPAFDEETFGPVAAVVHARDDDHAVALANNSPYGLGASIWTSDLERAERLAGELEAGCVFINEIVKSDPRLPFGGVKRSGYGRELADVGMHEFVNIKSVWVAGAERTPRAGQE